MSVRVKRYNTNAPDAANNGATEYIDTDQGQREGIDSEGYTYVFDTFGARNFLDDGRGLAVPSSGTSRNIIQDTIPFGDSRA